MAWLIVNTLQKDSARSWVGGTAPAQGDGRGPAEPQGASAYENISKGAAK